MYDRTETFGANDRLWSLIGNELTGRGIAAPEALTRGGDLWTLWQSSDLVLAQTCGLPYRTRLHGRVRLVATPTHDLPCEPGYYFSEIVVRNGDVRSTPLEFDGCRIAVNDRCSQSGWAAPAEWASRNGIGFGKALFTGSHAASCRAVAQGRAELAAIDAVSWKMIKRWDRHATRLRTIARTTPTPALPYITAIDGDDDLIRQALRDAVSGLRPRDRTILGLDGVIRISPDRYLEVADAP
ncbi:MAG: PhnD/SsuA/transferrin family substrate-binding protein [Rhodobacter sp.]|nr:PhnD/SsuA/transferrin family substrate-binding protein [Rhodobacter sp.]